MALKECDIDYDSEYFKRKMYEGCLELDESVRRFPYFPLIFRGIIVKEEVPLDQVFRFIEQLQKINTLYNQNKYQKDVDRFICSVICYKNVDKENIYRLLSQIDCYGELSKFGIYTTYKQLVFQEGTIASRPNYQLNKSEFIVILSGIKDDYSLLDDYPDEIVLGDNEFVTKAWEDYQQHCLQDIKTAY